MGQQRQGVLKGARWGRGRDVTRGAARRRTSWRAGGRRGEGEEVMGTPGKRGPVFWRPVRMGRVFGRWGRKVSCKMGWKFSVMALFFRSVALTQQGVALLKWRVIFSIDERGWERPVCTIHKQEVVRCFGNTMWHLLYLPGPPGLSDPFVSGRLGCSLWAWGWRAQACPPYGLLWAPVLFVSILLHELWARVCHGPVWLWQEPHRLSRHGGRGDQPGRVSPAKEGDRREFGLGLHSADC